ncbi:MAG: hypothetical protein L6R41_002610 [Letrouitia leprolyta]|nr:MAG: hypothetical protein L6R41_002610 [Letrouitia leprolyta]
MDPNVPSPPVLPPASYPATTKQAAGYIDSVLTDVTSTSFSDKIMVTITQNGRLAQWIHVPLDVSNPTSTDQYLPSSTGEDSLLPMTHLTPKTLLGGSNQERETVGQLYAAQVASIIAAKDPHERRSVIVGLGLSKFEASREVFYDTIDLVRRCL